MISLMNFAHFNIFSALSNVTQTVRNILQSNNITITPIKAYEVTTEKTKESNNSDGISLDEIWNVFHEGYFFEDITLNNDLR